MMPGNSYGLYMWTGRYKLYVAFQQNPGGTQFLNTCIQLKYDIMVCNVTVVQRAIDPSCLVLY